MKILGGKWFWILTLLMLAVVGLFSRLALWQYHRAQERTALLAALDAARHGPARPLPATGVDGLPRFAPVVAEGRYDGGRQVLMIEMPQPDGDAIGAEVLTPLHMPGGRLLLVNRGWVAAGPDGQTTAALVPPAGTVRVRGLLSSLPTPGVRLGGAGGANAGRWPQRLLYPDWTGLDRLYGTELIHRVLLLAPAGQGGYDRAWRLKPAHGPQENYSYMVQWIGLALTVFIVWLALTVRAFRGERNR